MRFERLRNIIRRKYLLDQLGIPDDGVILLSVGELNENKNHVAVIKALAQLKNDRLHYCIAGAGALEDMLREMAEDNEVNLHLLGYRDDVPELMSIADVFVHPSFREGLPVALMEAMVAGLPVIGSDIRGIRDLIEDGKGGWVIDPYIPQTLEYVLKEACEKKTMWKEMGNHNLNFIRDFDKMKVKKIMGNVYKEKGGYNKL